LRGSGTIGGRGVDGRGGGVGDAGRAEAGKKGRHIAGIGDGESARRSVVRKREAKEFGCEGVGFDVIECGEAGDEKGKVRGVVVFDTEVIYHQDKSDGTG
jgi:hypothetical protein